MLRGIGTLTGPPFAGKDKSGHCLWDDITIVTTVLHCNLHCAICFFIAYIIDRTGSTSSAFYVGSTADILAASVFALILFVNRERPTKDDKLHNSEYAVEGENSKEVRK